MILFYNTGTVTLWSPNVKKPLVKMLCHRGPVKAIAIDQGGWYGIDDAFSMLSIYCLTTMGPAAQNCFSVNPGLKFNPLF